MSAERDWRTRYRKNLVTAADVFAHNHAMLRVFHKPGRELKSSLADGVYRRESYFDLTKRAGGAGERGVDAAEASAASP